MVTDLTDVRTQDIADTFSIRIQNKMELAFVSDTTLHALLNALDREEIRRFNRKLMVEKTIKMIFKSRRLTSSV